MQVHAHVTEVSSALACFDIAYTSCQCWMKSHALGFPLHLGSEMR